MDLFNAITLRYSQHLLRWLDQQILFPERKPMDALKSKVQNALAALQDVELELALPSDAQAVQFGSGQILNGLGGILNGTATNRPVMTALVGILRQLLLGYIAQIPTSLPGQGAPAGGATVGHESVPQQAQAMSVMGVDLSGMLETLLQNPIIAEARAFNWDWKSIAVMLTTGGIDLLEKTLDKFKDDLESYKQTLAPNQANG